MHHVIPTRWILLYVNGKGGRCARNLCTLGWWAVQESVTTFRRLLSNKRGLLFSIGGILVGIRIWLIMRLFGGKGSLPVCDAFKLRSSLSSQKENKLIEQLRKVTVARIGNQLLFQSWQPKNKFPFGFFFFKEQEEGCQPTQQLTNHTRAKINYTTEKFNSYSNGTAYWIEIYITFFHSPFLWVPTYPSGWTERNSFSFHSWGQLWRRNPCFSCSTAFQERVEQMARNCDDDCFI